MSKWENTLFKINENTVKTFAKKWNSDENSLKLISKGINLVYVFKSNNEKNFLRITHNDIRSYQEIKAAISFQNHLFQNKVKVCAPLKSMENKYIESIKANGSLFFATVCSNAQGNPLNLGEISNKNLFHWGRALAKLHLSSEKYFNETNSKYLSVFDLLKESKQYSKSESLTIQNVIHDLEVWLKSIIQNKDNYGLTHGDHRDANVIFNNNEITFIDFDEPVYNFYLSDIVRPFIYFYENNTKIPDKIIPFIEGYRSLREIQYDEEILYNFAKLKAFEMYLWTKNNWDNESAPGGGNQIIFIESLKKIVKM